MILIADSGSTKCSWALCNKKQGLIREIKTIGFNPYFITKTDILLHLKKSELKNYRKNVKKIFFYGAGCSSAKQNNLIKEPLEDFFKNAKIIVNHDLNAACYAMYNNNPNITCILGTGSNSCYYDGENIIENAPALGFLIGDEASGNYFGKKLLNLYFNHNLPIKLKQKFEDQFETDLGNIKEKIYNNTRANVYLAKYFPFISQNKNHQEIKDLIYESLNNFFLLHICCYKNYKKVEINFIGSVAYALADEINIVANEKNCTIGNIIKNPIHNLIKYHLKKNIN